MSIDKPHYYDGKPYDILFERALREVREIIVQNVEDYSKVVDIACGTGSLVLDLAQKCSEVTGVELSSKMVEYAKGRPQVKAQTNVDFLHADATNLACFTDQQFDYLTVSMALHEMPPELRHTVLNEAKRIAKKIIIADYATPLPISFAGIRTRIVEFLAGISHFRGFRDFQNNNGIDQLLKESQLYISHEAINRNRTIRVVVAYQE